MQDHDRPHEENTNASRILVLEALLPRIEKVVSDNAVVLFRKVDDIKDNMVTKSMIGDLATANENNKKKLQFIQLQVAALAGFFFLSLLIGSSKTLAIAIATLPKVVGP